MTEGEVCPERRKSGEIGLSKPIRRSETWFAGRKCRSWFPDRGSSATIGTEFGSHLGNVNQVLSILIVGIRSICASMIAILALESSSVFAHLKLVYARSLLGY